MKRRVEIEEQHDLFNPLFVCKVGGGVPFHIDRTKIDLKDQPSSFKTFCDEVDSTFEKASNLKYVCFNASLNFFALLLDITLLLFVLMRWIRSGSLSPFVIILSITTIILLLYLILLKVKVDTQMNHMFNEVKAICTKYNLQDAVSYEFHVERYVGWWWCTRPRKMYLMIDYSAQDVKKNGV